MRQILNFRFNFRKNKADATERQERTLPSRKHGDFDREAAFWKRTYPRAVAVVLFAVVIAFAVRFLMYDFNNHLRENGSRLSYTIESLRQRFSFSESMLSSQYKVFLEIAQDEAAMEALHLENLPEDEWQQGMDVLIRDDNNLEFFYYRGGDLVLKSSNAGEPGIDYEMIRRYSEAGKASMDYESYNIYAAEPLRDGILLAMYRNVNVDNLSSLNMRNIRNLTIGKNSGILIYNRKTGSIYHADDKSWSNDNINDAGIKEIFDNAESVGRGDYDLLRLLVSLDKYRTASYDINGDVRATAYFSIRECFYSTVSDDILLFVFFLAAGAVIVSGAAAARIVRYPVRTDDEYISLIGRMALDKVILKRSLAMFMISTCIATGAAAYVSALVYLSDESFNASDNLDNVVADKEYSIEKAGGYTNFRDQLLTEELDDAVKLIEANKELRTDEKLLELVHIIENCHTITIYNSSGRSVISSDGYVGYTLGSDGQKNSASLVLELLDSDESSRLLNAENASDESFYAAKCRFNSGVIRFAVINDQLQNIIDGLSNETLLVEENFGSNAVLYYNSEKPAELEIAYAGSQNVTHIENTLTDKELYDNYFGLCKINGERYYINVAADTNIPGNYFICAGSINGLFVSLYTVLRFFLTGLSVIFAAAVCFMTPFELYKDKIIDRELIVEVHEEPLHLHYESDKTVHESAAADYKTAEYFNAGGRAASVSSEQAAVSANIARTSGAASGDKPLNADSAGRTASLSGSQVSNKHRIANNRSGRHSDISDEDAELNAELERKVLIYRDGMKLLEKGFDDSVRLVSRGFLIWFSLFMLYGLAASRHTGMLVRYLFYGDWERGFNIFSVTLVLLIMLAGWAVSLVIVHCTDAISQNTSPSGVTICKLVISLVKFVSLVVVIVLSLTELGVETGRILAGAGLTSVIIGIGAQSTVSDILTGLFIIFEGHFHVGDFVKIDGWKGCIREIGVRTTSIEGYQLDEFRCIRVIDNSSLKDVINLSTTLSFAIAYFYVPYSADMRDIDALLDEHRDSLRALFPQIIGGPRFDGIVEYGSSAKKVQFRAECDEADRYRLERKLCQYIGDMLEKNGFGTPYNRAVILTKEEEEEESR